MKGTKRLKTPKCKQGTYFPASATVEAALVIPLFLYGALAVIYILQITAVKQQIQHALYEDARKISGYAYLYEQSVSIDNGNLGSVIPVSMAWGFLLEELGPSYAKNHYIVGGNAGFVMAASKICLNDAAIELSVSYSIRNPYDIFGIGMVSLTQKAKTDAWLGEKGDAYTKNGDKKEQQEQLVYVTARGDVYHVDRNCTYLTRIIVPKSKDELPNLRNVDGEPYAPCERCGNKLTEDNQIYVTQYGNRYHTDIQCTQLARVILEIPISKVGARSECKKCGGG